MLRCLRNSIEHRECRKALCWPWLMKQHRCMFNWPFRSWNTDVSTPDITSPLMNNVECPLPTPLNQWPPKDRDEFHALKPSIIAWGNSLENQCGIHACDVYSIPHVIASTAGCTVIDIAAGGSHSLAIIKGDRDAMNCGSIYGWGSNFYGQVGPGEMSIFGDDSIDEDVSHPSLVTSLGPKRFTDVSCGTFHSMALATSSTEGGSGVYIWGSALLGFRDRLYDSMPRELPLPSVTSEIVECEMNDRPDGSPGNVIAISAGGSQSALITSTGDLFLWGWLWSGASNKGRGEIVPVTRPTVVPLDGNVVVMACGAWHVAVCLAEEPNRIYIFGLSGASVPRPRSRKEATLLPSRGCRKMCPFFHDPEDEFLTYRHGMETTDDTRSREELWNETFSTNTEIMDDYVLEHNVMDLPISEDDSVVALSAGDGFTMARTAFGRLFTMGANDFGQLGGGEICGPGPVEINMGSPVTAISCGDFHAVASFADGRVADWGLLELEQKSEELSFMKLTEDSLFNRDTVPDGTIHWTPRVVVEDHKVSMVSAGFGFTIAT